MLLNVVCFLVWVFLFLYDSTLLCGVGLELHHCLYPGMS